MVLLFSRGGWLGDSGCGMGVGMEGSRVKFKNGHQLCLQTRIKYSHNIMINT